MTSYNHFGSPLWFATHTVSPISKLRGSYCVHHGTFSGLPGAVKLFFLHKDAASPLSGLFKISSTGDNPVVLCGVLL